MFGALSYLPILVGGDVGVVDDLGELFSSVRMLVVPAGVQGTGVNTKIISAFAHGLPVVCNVAAMSGITDGSTVKVESLDDMAEAVTRLHEDWQLWEGTRDAAYDFLEKEASFGVWVNNMKFLSTLHPDYVEAQYLGNRSALAIRYNRLHSQSLYAELQTIWGGRLYELLKVSSIGKIMSEWE